MLAVDVKKLILSHMLTLKYIRIGINLKNPVSVLL